MRPDLLRPLLGTLGLLIGFTLYALAGKLAEPWQSVAIGGMFALLGLSAWVYARGERWIQGLGLLLLIYGLLRATVLR
ncbi:MULTISPECIES: hypothetical protein [Deinococcus]|uniref:Uncharacterized protein n=4 Tax=Deinococcus TaxID=1298 RepID=A0ACC6KMN0_9DEIO|nr:MULTISPECIES: hypothetical protein [Deinococcus]MDR6220790.1 hypothetical protein [Deinococcus soli (ex Cha et al. 2016)]MDR6330810.1 hypothetical protein [Deinococcus soli (ex Cha et al. 2016)]MDR6753889.1 hypothetical protein [Deinococcus soli (ex Cha et al. 2016)]MXV18310.1 hypothetical protein [Deinococcus xianganensis]NTY00953.1 hypothetical protein [Deinococcus sp. JMULE3]